MKRLLLVDDDAAFLKMLSSLLQRDFQVYILKDKPAAFGNPDYRLELPDKKTDQQRYVKHE